MSSVSRPTDLLKEVEASRLAIARDVTAFKYQIDIPRRAKDAVRDNPVRWLGSAALVGFVFAYIKPRRRPVRNRDGQPVKKGARPITFFGFLWAVAKIALPLARPMLSAIAAKRFAEMASKL